MDCRVNLSGEECTVIAQLVWWSVLHCNRRLFVIQSSKHQGTSKTKTEDSLYVEEYNMIIEIFQWFDPHCLFLQLCWIFLFVLSEWFLNQSKISWTLLIDKHCTRFWIKTFIFIHGTHDRLSCECLFGVNPFDIWSYCENLKVLWSVHVLPGIFYFEILILGRLSVIVFVMNFLVSLGTCTCVSQRKAWKEEMNEEEKPLDR